MCQLFLLPNKCRKPGRLHSEDGEVENNDICIESLPGLHVKWRSQKNHGFQTIRDKFLGLSTDSKICFLRFVVLPENQEVNQMMLFIGVLWKSFFLVKSNPKMLWKTFSKSSWKIFHWTCWKLIQSLSQIALWHFCAFVNGSYHRVDNYLVCIRKKKKKPRMEHLDFKNIEYKVPTQYQYIYIVPKHFILKYFTDFLYNR